VAPQLPSEPFRRAVTLFVPNELPATADAIFAKRTLVSMLILPNELPSFLRRRYAAGAE
jgi:hypothetical protein